MCHGSGTGGKINLPRETDRHRATAFSFVSMILDGIIAYRCFLTASSEAIAVLQVALLLLILAILSNYNDYIML